ncbi:hypothetical protein [Parasedimentitalea huanghaiensis]|uniref:Uncharacterized protein n=1 Tax=Parasedimentitalea huanghaiensis TaxID=2682100 RepID=A0A6L6WAG3_9RHOB|nr:hypothetical protein [Zongyanglinia huanghaiensis]MVO14796.1 hypothetical protein [Zongyanglinia huanghaiensis]
MSYLKAAKADVRAIDLHYKRCQKEQIPYVLCLTRRTKADVDFDFISLEPALEARIDARAEEVRDRAADIYRSYATKQSEYLMSAKVISLKNLDIPSAEHAAAALYELVSEVIGAGVEGT